MPKQGQREFKRMQKAMAAQRRMGRSGSSKVYKKKSAKLGLNTLAMKQLGEEATAKGKHIEVGSEGLSKEAMRLMDRSMRLELADDKSLSADQRRMIRKKRMKTIKKLYGKGGKYAAKSKNNLPPELAKNLSKGSKFRAAKPKTGMFQAIKSAGPSSEEKRSATIFTGKEAARDIQTGTDRDGNRVGYSSDRGPSPSLPSRGSSPSDGRRSPRSNPRF